MSILHTNEIIAGRGEMPHAATNGGAGIGQSTVAPGFCRECGSNRTLIADC